MAKAVALIAFALCILAIAGNVQGHTDDKFYTDPLFKFSVEGEVYCATCIRESWGDYAGTYLTHLEKNGESEVEIKCRSRKNGTVTLIQPVTVDNGGFWSTNMENSHEDDICTVAVVKSPDPQCNVKVPGFRGAKIDPRVYQDKDGRRTFYVDTYMGYLANAALHNCRKVKSKSGKLIPATTLPWLYPNDKNK